MFPGHVLALAAFLAIQAAPGYCFTDAEVIDGFNRTVFGSEFVTAGRASRVVKKFTEPVRFYIDNRTGQAAAHRNVLSFIESLPSQIEGLPVLIVHMPADANFRVLILNRSDYRAVVQKELLRRAPGDCLVRVIAGADGIARSDAVIVTDKGNRLFRKCVVQEILQGLGPVNDDSRLTMSVFNDRTRHTNFTAFDRFILNTLYDPQIRAGMSRAEAASVLPRVVAEVRRRLERLP